MKYWRETKKYEWIEARHRAGLEVNLKEIEKKEKEGEPLEWELQLISKDYETRLEIENILTKRHEIEEISIANNNINNLNSTALSYKTPEINSHHDNTSVSSSKRHNNQTTKNSKINDFENKYVNNIIKETGNFITSSVQTISKEDTYRAKERQKKKTKESLRFENNYKDELRRLERKQYERYLDEQDEEDYKRNALKRKIKLYEVDAEYDSDNSAKRSKYYSSYKNNLYVLMKDKALRRKFRPDNIKLLEDVFDVNYLSKCNKQNNHFKDYKRNTNDDSFSRKRSNNKDLNNKHYKNTSFINEEFNEENNFEKKARTQVTIKEITDEETDNNDMNNQSNKRVNGVYNNNNLSENYHHNKNNNTVNNNNELALKESNEDDDEVFGFNNKAKNIKRKINIKVDDEDDLYTKKEVKDDIFNEIKNNKETIKNLEISKEDYLKTKINKEKIINDEREAKLKQKKELSNVDLIQLQKNVFEKIPKEKSELFKYPINWEFISKVSYSYLYYINKLLFYQLLE